MYLFYIVIFIFLVFDKWRSEISTRNDYSKNVTIEDTRLLMYETLKRYFGENWLKLIEEIQIVSIGPQTSTSCEKFIRKPDKEANPHDLDGLLKSCLEINDY